MKTYIAAIHKAQDTNYGVSFPDFPGCISVGNTIKETKTMAKEALEFHIKGMVEDKEVIPEPSVLDDILDYSDALEIFKVTVEV